MPELATTILPPGVYLVVVTDPTPVRHIALLARECAAPNLAANRAVELLHEIAQRDVRRLAQAVA